MESMPWVRHSACASGVAGGPGLLLPRGGGTMTLLAPGSPASQGVGGGFFSWVGTTNYWVRPQICGQGGRIRAARGSRRIAATPDQGQRGSRRFAATPGPGLLPAQRRRGRRRCGQQVVAVAQVLPAAPSSFDGDGTDSDELLQVSVDAVDGPLAQPPGEQGAAGHPPAGGLPVPQQDAVEPVGGVGDLGVDDPLGDDREVALDDQGALVVELSRAVLSPVVQAVVRVFVVLHCGLRGSADHPSACVLSGTATTRQGTR